ncbi:hypothetical protein ACLB2K_058000 [Fragaria x ananassa]
MCEEAVTLSNVKLERGSVIISINQGTGTVKEKFSLDQRLFWVSSFVPRNWMKVSASVWLAYSDNVFSRYSFLRKGSHRSFQLAHKTSRLLLAPTKHGPFPRCDQLFPRSDEQKDFIRRCSTSSIERLVRSAMILKGIVRSSDGRLKITSIKHRTLIFSKSCFSFSTNAG